MTTGTEPTVPRPPRTVGRTVVAAVGLLLMLPVGFLYLSSGLVVPGPWLFVLWALFLALLLAAAHLARRRSWWVPAVPAAAFALWLVVLSLGAQLLGWQA